MISRRALESAILGAVPLAVAGRAHAEAAPAPKDTGKPTRPAPASPASPGMEVARDDDALPEGRDGRDAPMRRGGCGGGSRRLFGVGQISAGYATVTDAGKGGYARLEMHVGEKPRREIGSIFGITMGAGGFGTGNAGGGGAGLGMFVGVAGKRPYLTAGLAFDAVTYDRFRGNGNLGIFSPIVSGALGYDWKPFRVFVDARYQHLWHPNGDTPTRLFGLGLGIGLIGLRRATPPSCDRGRASPCRDRPSRARASRPARRRRRRRGRPRDRASRPFLAPGRRSPRRR